MRQLLVSLLALLKPSNTVHASPSILPDDLMTAIAGGGPARDSRVRIDRDRGTPRDATPPTPPGSEAIALDHRSQPAPFRP
jgi:hypothetical protein